MLDLLVLQSSITCTCSGAIAVQYGAVVADSHVAIVAVRVADGTNSGSADRKRGDEPLVRVGAAGKSLGADGEEDVVLIGDAIDLRLVDALCERDGEFRSRAAAQRSHGGARTWVHSIKVPRCIFADPELLLCDSARLLLEVRTR